MRLLHCCSPICQINDAKLPCIHIFNKRRSTNNCLYDEKLCDKRSTRNYYYKSQTILKEPLMPYEGETPVFVDIQPKNSKRLLSANEKFQKSSIKLSKLAKLLSISSQHTYERRMAQLDNIISLWSKNEEISIVQLSNMKSTSLVREEIDQPKEFYTQHNQSGKSTLDSDNVPSTSLVCEEIDQLEELYSQNDIPSTSLVCETIDQPDECQFNVGTGQSTSDEIDVVKNRTENVKIAIKDVILPAFEVQISTTLDIHSISLEAIFLFCCNSKINRHLRFIS